MKVKLLTILVQTRFLTGKLNKMHIVRIGLANETKSFDEKI